MRIGFDAKRIFRNTSGLGNYSRSTVELLAKYFPDNHYFLYSGFDRNRTGFQIPEKVELVTPSSWIGDICPSLWRSGCMASDIRKHRLDIYHGLSNELPFDIREGGAKSVVTMHDLIFIRYPNLYKKIDRYLYEKKYRRSCRYADHIIAISRQTKNDIIDFWNIPEELISVVYQGCNPQFYQVVDQETKKRVKEKYALPDQYILSVGTLEERKNLMLTLQAMVAGHIDVPLVACGRYTEYVKALQAYAYANGLEDRVKFLYNVDFSDLPAVYQMASVAVYVSLFEGFGIPILEALNSGVPMITSKGGVFGETGGDACLYVGQYDREDMAEALKTALNDTQRRNEMIERGYKYALNFRDDVVARNLYAVYKKLL